MAVRRSVHASSVEIGAKVDHGELERGCFIVTGSYISLPTLVGLTLLILAVLTSARLCLGNGQNEFLAFVSSVSQRLYFYDVPAPVGIRRLCAAAARPMRSVARSQGPGPRRQRGEGEYSRSVSTIR